MRVLLVVAHPDDEALGCGGTVSTLSAQGAVVHSCILCAEVTARVGKPQDDDLRQHVLKAQRDLGIEETHFASFPNIAFNTVPHLELVRTIERAMEASRPDVLVTHHPGDLNNDHLHTASACQAAARLSQRQSGRSSLQGFYYMEIPSSTDWAFPGAMPAFIPATYCEIGAPGLAAKLQAMSRYEGVMRPFPHPRSSEAITGLAAYRGGQAGMSYAEAFQPAFTRLGFSI